MKETVSLSKAFAGPLRQRRRPPNHHETHGLLQFREVALKVWCVVTDHRQPIQNLLLGVHECRCRVPLQRVETVRARLDFDEINQSAHPDERIVHDVLATQRVLRVHARVLRPEEDRMLSQRRL